MVYVINVSPGDYLKRPRNDSWVKPFKAYLREVEGTVRCSPLELQKPLYFCKGEDRMEIVNHVVVMSAIFELKLQAIRRVCASPSEAMVAMERYMVANPTHISMIQPLYKAALLAMDVVTFYTMGNKLSRFARGGENRQPPAYTERMCSLSISDGGGTSRSMVAAYCVPRGTAVSEAAALIDVTLER